MKLLHVSDLHFNQAWYAWLLGSAQDYEVVVIAGDLLAGEVPQGPQIEFLSGWFAAWRQRGVPLVIGCGNHDHNRRDKWLDPFAGEEVLVPGRSAVIRGILFTSCYFDSDDELNRPIWDAGAALRDAEPSRPWFVVHHEPPPCKVGSYVWSSGFAGYRAKYLRPTAVLSGHDHLAPLEAGTCCDRLGEALIFNPGYQEGKEVPNHIVIETGDLSWTWNR